MSERRSIIRWFGACAIVPLLAVALSSLPTAQTLAATTYTVYNSPEGSVGGSEILDLTVTPDERYAVVVGTNDGTETKVRTISLSSANRFTKKSFDIASQIPARLVRPVVSSVAVHPSGGYAIVTVRENDAATITAGNEQPGVAIFVSINADGSMAFARASALDLGIYPESIAIAPNGQYAVVSNQDPDDGSANTIRRSGTISVIDLRTDAASATVLTNITPTLAATNTTRDVDDLAPETVAISPNSGRAFVTLQENNGIAIIDMNLDSLPTSVAAVPLPRQNTTIGPRLFPDGLAITPDSEYLVTANEGVNQDRPNSVSLFRIVSSTQLDYLADSGTAIATAVSSGGLPVSDTSGSEPEMVTISQMDGKLRAFVTLEKSDAVAAFDINPLADNKLQLQGLISLDRNQVVGPASRNPEGVAVATISGTLSYVITANTATHNVSLIEAISSNPSPSPSPSVSPSPSPSTPPNLTKRAWLPIIRP